jgi:hypothetical protein
MYTVLLTHVFVDKFKMCIGKGGRNNRYGHTLSKSHMQKIFYFNSRLKDSRWQTTREGNI